MGMMAAATEPLDTIKHFGRSCARDNRAARHHLLRGFVAEGTELALTGNFNGGNFNGSNFHHRQR